MLVNVRTGNELDCSQSHYHEQWLFMNTFFLIYIFSEYFCFNLFNLIFRILLFQAIFPESIRLKVLQVRVVMVCVQIARQLLS